MATDAKDALEDARAEKQKDDDKESGGSAEPLQSPAPPPTTPLAIFETCGDVVKLEPKDCKDKFLPGKVFVFVRVRAPEPQTLMLKWFDTKDKEFAKRELKVKKNLNGYRTYTWKNIRRPGKYNVRLYDPDQEEIGRHDFTIAKKN